MDRNPPKYPIRFFRWFCDPDYVEDIEGDLVERFEKRIQLKKPARWLLLLDVVKLFRPGIIKNFEGTQKLNYYGMFKHYLKISYRNLLRQKGFAFINIGGLVMGLTITLLISLWIIDEFSFDKDNENFDRVARVMQHISRPDKIETWLSTPPPLVNELRNQFGENFERLAISTWFGDYVLSQKETAIKTNGGFMEADAAHIMSLKMKKGNRDGLKEEAAILLSETTAKALFGEADPMNRTVDIYHEFSTIVKGVYKDFPVNSSFYGVTFIGSWDFFVASQPWMQEQIASNNWNNNSFQLYAQIAENTTMEAVSKKIEKVKQEHLSEADKKKEVKIFLHPMKDWHLRSKWKNGVKGGGLIQYVWWFGTIGAIVLLLACINFMNLSTSQSTRRAKEVGIRKSIGSFRNQIIAQFLTESILIVFIAFIIATLMAFILMPFFNVLTEKQIVIPLDNPLYWVLGIVLAVVVGLISGSYPAIYLSSFKAIHVLKGTFQSRLSAMIFRKSMIVFQFTISIALIIGTVVVIQQIKHAQNRPLGYDIKGTIAIEMSAPGHYAKSQVIKNELMSTGTVTQIAQASAPLTESWNRNTGFDWAGKDPDYDPVFETYFVTHNYGQTINWELIEGRDFSTAFSTDSTAMIINEAALGITGLEDPLGMEIKWFKKFKVIGVIKNMVVESPYHEIEPAAYIINPGDNINFFLLRLNPEIGQLDAITKIEEVFKANLPNTPFDFKFVNDVHQDKFQSIKRIGTLSSVFAMLAIAISCLGLFGLASLMMEQRTKEVGIRKVLGASVLALWKMLSREFLLLVLVACFIAIPISIYALTGWLEDYEYRIKLEWWVFATAGLVAMLISMLTVSLKSLRAAKSNPVDSLKYE